MFNKLEEIIKKVEGNVLSVCLDDKLMDSFKNNNKINLYLIEPSRNTGLFINKSKKNKSNTNKGKIINI